jgi:hypothetical protein
MYEPAISVCMYVSEDYSHIRRIYLSHLARYLLPEIPVAMTHGFYEYIFKAHTYSMYILLLSTIAISSILSLSKTFPKIESIELAMSPAYEILLPKINNF